MITGKKKMASHVHNKGHYRVVVVLMITLGYMCVGLLVMGGSSGGDGSYMEHCV